MNEQHWPYESLVALAAGELEGNAREAMERQMAQSPDLQREFDAVCAVLQSMHGAELAAPRREVVERAVALLRERGRETVGERVRQVVRHITELVFDSRRPAALAGFRASAGDEEYHLTYASDVAEIDVQVKHAPSSAGGGGAGAGGDGGPRRIVGQVAPLSTPPPNPTRARLMRRDDPSMVQVTEVDSRGMFALTAAKGEYDLVVEMGEEELVAQGLRLE